MIFVAILIVAFAIGAAFGHGINAETRRKLKDAEKDLSETNGKLAQATDTIRDHEQIFDVRDGDNYDEDTEGLEFPDVETAKAEALTAAREMLAEQISFGVPVGEQVFEVTDEETLSSRCHSRASYTVKCVSASFRQRRQKTAEWREGFVATLP